MSAYRTVIVAIDLDVSANTVIDRALAVAGTDIDKLMLVHVVEFVAPLSLGDDSVPSPDWMIDEEQLQDAARQSLARAAERPGLENAEQLVLLGTPKHEIVRLAEERHADLIVLGSHGRHGIELLLGSTANAVLHHAPCDVLAVRIK